MLFLQYNFSGVTVGGAKVGCDILLSWAIFSSMKHLNLQIFYPPLTLKPVTITKYNTF